MAMKAWKAKRQQVDKSGDSVNTYQRKVKKLADEFGITKQEARAALKDTRGQIDRARKKLEELGETAEGLPNPDMTVTADTSQANRQLSALEARISQLPGWYQLKPTVEFNPAGIKATRRSRKDAAFGGTYFPGDYGIVGERGPERIRNNGGVTTVTPMAGQNGSTFVFNIGYVKDARTFAEQVGPEITRYQRRQGVLQ